MKMHQNSLFAVLLRSPWWVSFAAAGAAFALTRMVLSSEYALYAAFTALPFAAIGCVSGWRQLRAPSAAKIGADLDLLRALSWEDFCAKLEAAYRREGYEVKRVAGAADLELEKSGRVTLVAAKRWKATRTGIEPLRALDALRLEREAAGAICLAAGQVTDTARSFAAKTGIQLLEGPALAALLAG